MVRKSFPTLFSFVPGSFLKREVSKGLVFTFSTLDFPEFSILFAISALLFIDLGLYFVLFCVFRMPFPRLAVFFKGLMLWFLVEALLGSILIPISDLFEVTDLFGVFVLVFPNVLND